MMNLCKALLVCLALASCDSKLVNEKLALAPCAVPVTLPDRALNDQEIEVLWGRDRTNLRECAGRVEVISGRAPSTKDSPRIP